jgi:hypothetical protein
MKKILIKFIAALAILIVALFCFVGYDILQDRKYNVLAGDSVPAYPDWEQYHSKDMKPVFILLPDTTVRVKRIRYGKDYMAIRVQNATGEEGWIFHGPAFRLEKSS